MRHERRWGVDMKGGIEQSVLTALAAAVIVTLGATMLAVSTGSAAIQAFAVGMGLASTGLGMTFWSLDPGSAARAASRRALAELAPILLYGFGSGVAVVEGARRISEPATGREMLPAFAMLAATAAVLGVVLYLAGSRQGDWRRHAGPDRSAAIRGHVALGVAMAVTAAAALGVMLLTPPDGDPQVLSIDAVGSVVIGLLMAVFAGNLLIEARHAFVLRPSPAESTPRHVPTHRAGEAGPPVGHGAETVAVPEAEPDPERDAGEVTVAAVDKPATIKAVTASPAIGNPGQVKTEPGQKPPIVARARARRGRGKRR